MLTDRLPLKRDYRPWVRRDVLRQKLAKRTLTDKADGAVGLVVISKPILRPTPDLAFLQIPSGKSARKRLALTQKIGLILVGVCSLVMPAAVLMQTRA
jgi:hypothetical protein